MTVSVSLLPRVEARLREQAAARGKSVDAYVADVLEQIANVPSVEEALAPFRKQVAESGMTDEQLDEFFEDLRDKAYQERQRRHP